MKRVFGGLFYRTRSSLNQFSSIDPRFLSVLLKLAERALADNLAQELASADLRLVRDFSLGNGSCPHFRFNASAVNVGYAGKRKTSLEKS